MTAPASNITPAYARNYWVVIKVRKKLGGEQVEQCGLPVGVPEAANAAQLVVPYPVPAHVRLHWHGGPVRANATVWDAVGRDVLHISAERTNGVDIHGLSRGVYTLQLQDPGGGVWRARFLKE